MDFKAIIKGPDDSFTEETIEYKKMQRDQAIEEARRDLSARSVPGATAVLYRVIKDANVYPVAHWKVNNNFVLVRQDII